MAQITPLKQTPATIIRRPGQLIIPKRSKSSVPPLNPPVVPPAIVGGNLNFTQDPHPSGIYQWMFSPDGVIPYAIPTNPNLLAAYPTWPGAIQGGTVNQNFNILNVVLEMNGLHVRCDYDGGTIIGPFVVCVVTL